MEAVIKQGVLHTQQQQKFGKKWKKVWVLLYGESTCSVARLEYFEFKEGMSLTERQSTKKTENKKIIKLSDCIRITDCPRRELPSECRSFHLETIEKLFVFAVESSEYDDWSQSLCEMAFPMYWSDRPLLSKSDSSQRSKKAKNNLVTMEENALYCTHKAVKEFRVAVRKTEAAERCHLQGMFLLGVEEDGLELKDLKSGEVLYVWPYRFLRRFGRDKVTFSFEAGRRCASGEGNFEFDTRQANGIFQIIESAIKIVRQGFKEEKQLPSDVENELSLGSRPFPPPALEAEEEGTPSELGEGQQSTKANAILPSLRCLSLESASDPNTRSASTMPWKPGSKGHQSHTMTIYGPVKGNQPQSLEVQSTYSEVRDVITKPSSRGNTKSAAGKKPQEDEAAVESEYAIPFDAIAQTLCLPSLIRVPHSQQDNVSEMGFTTFLPQKHEEAGDPLYDTIDESNFVRKEKATLPLPKDHIYDEPEGSDTPSVYDNPEEVKGHAWRLHGLECDPRGHEYPYNPHLDDYAVPTTAKQGVSKRRSGGRVHQQGNGSTDSEYDNVLVKKLEKKGTQ
ncbi:docking protein 2-like [Pristis pectinata]|uniref:docking protein 2-like n=1 Tax=Pristis pectinata TaxID=685728 RepID=UPI00223CF4AB|nr:docking protein 2-like [Pristis pectinata]